MSAHAIVERDGTQFAHSEASSRIELTVLQSPLATCARTAVKAES